MNIIYLIWKLFLSGFKINKIIKGKATKNKLSDDWNLLFVNMIPKNTKIEYNKKLSSLPSIREKLEIKKFGEKYRPGVDLSDVLVASTKLWKKILAHGK